MTKTDIERWHDLANRWMSWDVGSKDLAEALHEAATRCQELEKQLKLADVFMEEIDDRVNGCICGGDYGEPMSVHSQRCLVIGRAWMAYRAARSKP